MEKKKQEGDEVEYESDCEDLEDYKQDGYHPVYLGEKFKNSRYTVIQKLGWGHFSTVWLAEDKDAHHNDPNKYIAMKVQKSKPSYSEAALDEIQLLKTLREAKTSIEWKNTREEIKKIHNIELKEDDNFWIDLIDNFPHFGMHGKHFWSTFQIMGPNLLDLMRYFEKKYKKGVPVKIVKKIAVQMLIGLDYMHRISKVIHTDLKPENVMIELPPGDTLQFIEEIKQIKYYPLSMKYLKSVQSNSNNKKKKKKKKKVNNADSDISDNNNWSIQSEPLPETKQLSFSVQEKVENDDDDMVGNLKKKEEPTKIINESSDKDTSSNLATTNTNNSTRVENSETANQSKVDEINNILEEDSFQNKIVNELEYANDSKKMDIEKDDSTSGINRDQDGKMDIEYKIESEETVENENIDNRSVSNKKDKISNNENSDEKDSRSSSSGLQSRSSSSRSNKTNRSYYEKDEFTFYWKDKVKIILNEDIKIRIVDFGNAWWTYKHFTDNIQTREYRAPETIIGSSYDANTDIWSVACMIFELLTGDYLFRPSSGGDDPRDEAHIALFLSTLGKIPKKIALGGKYSRDLFNKNGKLLHASVPEDYEIDQILVTEYKFDKKEAIEIKEFLTPMLEYDITKRISAQEILKHKWLSN